MLSFFTTYILTNFIFGLILWAFIHKIMENSSTSTENIFIFLLSGLAGAPLLTIIGLYYCLLLLPHQSNVVYITIVVSFFSMIAIYAREILTYHIKNVWLKYRQECIVGISFFALLVTVSYIYTSKRPLTEHDPLEYATWAKILYQEKSIIYQPINYNIATGFTYIALHGYSFTLTGVWENLFSGAKYTDQYFKSINMYYAALLMLFLYGILALVNKKIAMFGVFILALTYGFFISTLRFHLDTFRITILCFATFFILNYFKSKSVASLYIGFIFMGFNASIHSLGVFMTVIWGLTFLLFDKSPLKDRITKLSIASACFLIFGGCHYVFDIFWGTGWLFQSIKFF
jgi:hypothetical protein